MVNQPEPGRLVRTFRSICTINPQTRALELAFAGWVVVWAICFLLSGYLLRNGLVNAPLAWLFPGAAVIASLVVLQRYFRFLAAADELTRKIQLDGMCFAFGFTIIVVLGVRAFAPLGTAQAEASDIAAIMCFAWVAGQFWGHWKYQ